MCIAGRWSRLSRGVALVENLAQCAAIMGEHGCQLAVEFTPRYTGGFVAEATDLCAAIGWERCRLVIDALHFFRSGAPWAELAELSAEQIAVVQWADAPATARRPLIEESRHGRLLPGDGGLDLSASLQRSALPAGTAWSAPRCSPADCARVIRPRSFRLASRR